MLGYRKKGRIQILNGEGKQRGGKKERGEKGKGKEEEKEIGRERKGEKINS
jgi:hypothetical protein